MSLLSRSLQRLQRSALYNPPVRTSLLAPLSLTRQASTSTSSYNSTPTSPSRSNPAPFNNSRTNSSNSNPNSRSKPPSSSPSTKLPSSTTLALSHLRKDEETRLLETNAPRRWTHGSLYSPRDLSPAEMRKWKRRTTPPSIDTFDLLSLKPLELYKNFSVMSEYVTEMGRIKPRSATGLRRVNQRRLGKAIRRARGLGLASSVHLHPMVIRAEMEGNGRLA